jgi:hypothetical protein
MLHYLMFHPMNQQKDCHDGLTSSDCVEANLRLTKSNIYNFSHTLLVLLPSTHTFQVHTQLKEHFATCTSFVYKQFYFLVYIIVNLYTSVSGVISISCVSGHKRLFTSYVISCYQWHHLCGRRLHYPISFDEILHTWGRTIHLQPEYVIMFLVDYPSSSHKKTNRCSWPLRPVRSCAPIHHPFARSAGRTLCLYLQHVS